MPFNETAGDSYREYAKLTPLDDFIETHVIELRSQAACCQHLADLVATGAARYPDIALPRRPPLTPRLAVLLPRRPAIA